MRECLKKNILKITYKIENNSAFGAIRQGMIMLIPLVVIGSIALMLMSLPIPAYQELLNNLLDGRVVEILNFIYCGVFNFFSVLLAVTTSISYAMLKRKKSEQHIGFGNVIILVVITLVTLVGYTGIQYDSFSIDALSNLNTFTALFVTLISGKIFFAIKNRKLFRVKKHGSHNDTVYTEAIEGIIPAAIIVVFFALLRQLFQIAFGVDGVQDLLEILVERFLTAFDNGLWAGISVILVTHLMWFFGIHGNNVLDAVIKQNFTDISVGIYSKTFQDVFIIFGGCGAILCLVIAILLVSKKKNIRNIAKLALPTVIFNISEIVVFGLPVILNPVFLIPYILVPIINCIISYVAIYLGLVPHVISEVEWTTPVLLSGYQATGSWAGVVLQIICIVIGVVIYMPFVRLFEKLSEKQMVEKVKRLVDELKREEETNSISSLTARTDELGSVARVLAADLEDAIKKRQLFLLYQPQINCEEKCIGAEALIRWVHPVVGFIYPPLIIQLAKEKNMLSKLEMFIFDEAARAVSEIQKNISEDFKISINITNESLAWDGFEKCMEESVEKHNIPNEKLWLEITEQDALSSSIDIIDKLQNLKKKGHKFLIDDFGMGHTSLMYLQTNYFDVVKLDGALTRDILNNTRNSDIIASIVYLGQSLHFTTVAEYVETKEQRDELAALGCDAFQGYLYSKPIPLNELIPWMEAHQ